MKELNRQVAGDHYSRLKIQPLEYALENDLGVCEHAVIKYVSRWAFKGGVEDLRKARHYLDIMIEREVQAGIDLGPDETIEEVAARLRAIHE
jgi:hypothetical protein